MDTTAKMFLSLFLLIVGGVFVMTGAPVFHVLPTDLANAFALACVLFAVILFLSCAGEAIGPGGHHVGQHPARHLRRTR